MIYKKNLLQAERYKLRRFHLVAINDVTSAWAKNILAKVNCTWSCNRFYHFPWNAFVYTDFKTTIGCLNHRGTSSLASTAFPS